MSLLITHILNSFCVILEFSFWLGSIESNYNLHGCQNTLSFSTTRVLMLILSHHLNKLSLLTLHMLSFKCDFLIFFSIFSLEGVIVSYDVNDHLSSILGDFRGQLCISFLFIDNIVWWLS